MKPLITLHNVSEVAEALKNVSPPDIQAEKQHMAQYLIDSFTQALHEFKQPIPSKSFQIELIEQHLQDLIVCTQALFDALDKKIQQKIMKTVKAIQPKEMCTLSF